MRKEELRPNNESTNRLQGAEPRNQKRTSASWVPKPCPLQTPQVSPASNTTSHCTATPVDVRTCPSGSACLSCLQAVFLFAIFNFRFSLNLVLPTSCAVLLSEMTFYPSSLALWNAWAGGGMRIRESSGCSGLSVEEEEEDMRVILREVGMDG